MRAEAGCTQADLNHAAHSFGLAVPVGVVSTTGIAGLTLGGGTGYLTRKYGLALDNLLEADLILADGRFVTVNADNPDLFGRSAVEAVTLVLLRRSSFVGVRWIRSLAVPCFWEMEHAREVMQWYREISLELPGRVIRFFRILEGVSGTAVSGGVAP